MKIVIANNKGGQGKTFFARLILWYLIQNPANKDKIAYLDVDDDQKNLASAFQGKNIQCFNRLEDIPDNIICVVDTPPSLRGSIPAIEQADILIAPIVLGKDAALGLGRVRDVRGKNDLRVVINLWDEAANEKEVEEFLLAENYNIIGRLTKYKNMAKNFDHDIEWYVGMTGQSFNYVVNLIKNLLAKPIC